MNRTPPSRPRPRPQVPTHPLPTHTPPKPHPYPHPQPYSSPPNRRPMPVWQEFMLGAAMPPETELTVEEIVNAMGFDGYHDGVNYLNAVCVIVLQKAKGFFESSLSKLKLRLIHVMSRCVARMLGDGRPWRYPRWAQAPSTFRPKIPAAKPGFRSQPQSQASDPSLAQYHPGRAAHSQPLDVALLSG